MKGGSDSRKPTVHQATRRNYLNIIDETIIKVKPEFVHQGVDERVLDELRTLWEQTLLNTRVIDEDIPPEPVRVSPPLEPRQPKPKPAPVAKPLPGAQVTTGPRSLPMQAMGTSGMMQMGLPPNAMMANMLPMMNFSRPITPQFMQQFQQQFQQQIAAAHHAQKQQQHMQAQLQNAQQAAQQAINQRQAVAAAAAAQQQLLHNQLQQQQQKQQQIAGPQQQQQQQPAGAAAAPGQGNHFHQFLRTEDRKRKLESISTPSDSKPPGPIVTLPQQDGPADDADAPPAGTLPAASDSEVAAAGGASGVTDQAQTTTTATAAGGGAGNDELDDEELGEDDDLADVDVEDVDGEANIDNYILGQWEKVQRSKGKWKVAMKGCIIKVNGKEYLVKKLNAEMQFH